MMKFCNGYLAFMSFWIFTPCAYELFARGEYFGAIVTLSLSYSGFAVMRDIWSKKN